MPPYTARFNRRSPARCTLFALLLWTLPAPGADLLEQGREAVQQGHPETAFRLFSEAAAAGDPAGAFGLGVLYFQGNGVEEDPEQSTHWFRIAAEAGHVPARFNLGNAYLQGYGTAQDPDLAEHWWRTAARSGYAQARFNLGTLLYKHGASAALREEGIAWYRAAAEAGFANALTKLAELGEPADYRDITPDPAREPLRGEARILTLDPKGFTIQLFSARQSESAARFVTRHGLDGLALRYRFLHGDEPWTGVIYGWYRDRREATDTIARLKPELRAAGPWPRPVADVQTALSETREKAEAVRPGRRAE